MLMNLFYTVGIPILLPAVLIFILWRANFASKLEWYLHLISTTILVSWLFLAGNWSWISYYIRFLWIPLLIIAIVISRKKMRDLPFRVKFSTNQHISVGMYVFLIIIFGLYNIFVISSYTVDEETIELEFPLKDGTYYVGQGGNHAQMNHHHLHAPQKFALDIVKLNQYGARAVGFNPENLNKYEIFGAKLYSPCNGDVIEARNNMPDLTPPHSNPDLPEGNYVALACDGIDAIVYLAHMQENSVAVEEDTSVQAGALIGIVGNSDNTTEPHLHIHAEKDGEGVPILFNGRFLVRNSLVR